MYSFWWCLSSHHVWKKSVYKRPNSSQSLTYFLPRSPRKNKQKHTKTKHTPKNPNKQTSNHTQKNPNKTPPSHLPTTTTTTTTTKRWKEKSMSLNSLVMAAYEISSESIKKFVKAVKVRVIHTGIKLYSLVVSITTPSLNEIGRQMSEWKPVSKWVGFCCCCCLFLFLLCFRRGWILSLVQ